METRAPRKITRTRSSWHGTAFVVEALALFVFLIASIAILLQVLEVAYDRGAEADRVASASFLATNEAERFASEPDESSSTTTYDLIDNQWIPVSMQTENTYDVVKTVVPETQRAGTLYRATIEIFHQDALIYTLETACYINGGGR